MRQAGGWEAGRFSRSRGQRHRDARSHVLTYALPSAETTPGRTHRKLTPMGGGACWPGGDPSPTGSLVNPRGSGHVRAALRLPAAREGELLVTSPSIWDTYLNTG